MKHQNARLETFLSLTWYEVTLRFLFTFVAKTSEVLLAAGLVVSTANFLTDGSILATHPEISIAWAWAQALAIDSSLGVSLSYTFQCLKQEEWIRGTLYGLLTLLLSGVAGGITNIDIVSHALHLPMNDAMVQMGINVAILSRLRAIAVIGFILMSRLRDLPITTLETKTEPEPQRSMVPESGSSQELKIQAAIQSLCSQFRTEEMVHILTACATAKKLIFTWVTPQNIPEPRQSEMDQQPQDHSSSESASEPNGTGAVQGEPEPPVASPLQSEPVPTPSVEPSRKASGATEPSVPEEHLLRRDPGPSSQVQRDPEPIAAVPSKERMLEQAPAREPVSGDVAQLEPDGAPPQQRMEQAYQSLVAEGKKLSGRALAERAHVHRSTCVEWLRMKQQQTPENEVLPQEPERDGSSLLDTLPDGEVMDALEHEIISVQAETPETAMMELPEMKMNHYSAAGNVSPGVFPDSSLPEDIPDV